MQPKLFDRFFLVLLLLVLLALAALCLGIAFGIVTGTHLAAFAMLISGRIVNAAILCAASVALLALTLRVLIAFFRGEPDGPALPSSIHVNSGEFGALHISTAALDAMVQRFCHANGKIRECYSAIYPAPTGISLKLRVSVVNDVNIPEFTQALQSGLKQNIEELSGLKVLDVDVLIIPMVNAK
jgi:hypothetical protein